MAFFRMTKLQTREIKSSFLAAAQEAARLRQLASIEGKDEYHSYVVLAKRSLLQVMQDFPSAKPTLGESR